MLVVRPSIGLTCEHIHQSTSNLKYDIRPPQERTYYRLVGAIDFGSSAKNKMATIKLFKIYAMDTSCEGDIFRIVSPINFKFDL